jgi:hypothetical protein
MTSQPFAEVIRVRLLALISIRNTSPSALSAKMNRAKSYLVRKLNPPTATETRELTTAEVDEVLAALDADAGALFVPVLGNGDRELLAWIATRPDGEGRTAKDADRIFARAERAIERLTAQRLLSVDNDGTLTLTDQGATLTA